MNKVYLTGNLTRDPEVRYTQGGKPYARLGIAVNRPFSKDKAVDFFNLVAWDKAAELIGKFSKKGSKLIVEGRLQTSTYEKNGAKVTSTDIIVENFEFADDKKKPKDDFDGTPIDEEDTPF